MRRILHWVRAFSFWGFLYALLFFFGFQVSIAQMIEAIKSGDLICRVLCIYMLISCVAFPVLFVLDIVLCKKKGIPIKDTLAVGILPLLWPPYKALDIKGHIRAFESVNSRASRVYELKLLIKRIIDFALWWAITVVVVIHMIKGDDSIPIHVRALGSQRLVISIASLVLIFVILWLVGSLMQKSMMKRMRRALSINARGTRAQRYFDKHPEQIPSGCAACGGPYPECRSSCNMFDV